MLIFIAVSLLMVLLLAGLPIAFSLGLTGMMLLFLILGDSMMMAVPQTMFGAVDSFTLLSIPFFILTADILIASGATRRLVNAVETLIGHWRGGLATVAIVTCAFFSAISGSSAATAVAVGSVLVPEMMRRGYNPAYSAGLVAVGGGLGILIPPSIPMIVYGAVAEQSVGRLFMAGIVPGLILTVALMAMGMYVLGRDRDPTPRASWGERAHAVKEAMWIIFLPVIIAGLIYGGIATPTEAAGVSVVYALFCSFFVYRDMAVRDLPGVLAEAGNKSALILLIIAGATVFSYALTLLQVPQAITSAVLNQDLSQSGFLLIVNGILLILGMFLDITSILLLTSPIFLPIVESLGIDKIHFGMIFVLNMELALITPPLGIHLFILSGITRLPVATVFKGVLPFALVALVVLMLVTYVPAISLVLIGR